MSFASSLSSFSVNSTQSNFKKTPHASNAVDTPQNPINTQIRAKRVRVVQKEADGKSLSVIMSWEDAMAMAETLGHDLIQVSGPTSTLDSERIETVCRIMPYDKFKFEQQKEMHRKDKLNRQATKKNELKEMQIRVNIDPHDLSIKTKQAIGFLEEGHRVKCVLKFKGRELTHMERGDEVMLKVKEVFSANASSDAVKKEGKTWIQIWSPKR
jgi:translation initiation factor IF-3